MATVSAVVAVVAVVAAAIAAVHGADLRNVIITGFGEMPYEPAPGWQAGGFFQSDVYPVDVNGDDGQPQTMDVALRTRILVEDPNEKKSTSDGTENNSAEEDVKSASTNLKVKEKNNSLDQDKAKEIEEELLTARTRSGLRKLNGQRDTQDKSKPEPSVPKSSFSLSQYHQSTNPDPSYHHHPSKSNGYNNREYYGDLGEGWNLEDADEILGGRNYNILTQTPHGYNPNHYPPPPPPPHEIPPPRFHPSSFYPFPGFGYKPYPPPPSFGPVVHSISTRNSRAGYYRSAETQRPRSRLRQDVVYGRPTDSEYQPSKRRGSLAPRVYPYYDDYLSGA